LSQIIKSEVMISTAILGQSGEFVEANEVVTRVNEVETLGSGDDADGLLDGLNYAEGKPAPAADEGRVARASRDETEHIWVL
jgi:hypothetical protein